MTGHHLCRKVWLFMCELMALAFNEAVRPHFSFRGFIHRGATNSDGWGIAHYPDDKLAAQIIKEPLPANRSTLAAFLRDHQELRSRIFIAHVRWATSSVHYANTHPFSRVLRGSEYVFAHNGSLDNGYKEALPVGPWSPLGSTDSEYAFCHLMNIVESQIPRWNRTGFEHLERAMRRINKSSKFNCLLSDGEFLFCYRDKNEYKETAIHQTRSSLFNHKTGRRGFYNRSGGRKIAHPKRFHHCHRTLDEK